MRCQSVVIKEEPTHAHEHTRAHTSTRLVLLRSDSAVFGMYFTKKAEKT